MHRILGIPIVYFHVHIAKVTDGGMSHLFLIKVGLILHFACWNVSTYPVAGSDFKCIGLHLYRYTQLKIIKGTHVRNGIAALPDILNVMHDVCLIG